MTIDPDLSAVIAHEAVLGFWRVVRARLGRLGEEQAGLLTAALVPVIRRVWQVERALELEPSSLTPLPAPAPWSDFVRRVGMPAAEELRAELDVSMARFLDAFRAGRRAGALDLELVGALRDVIATYNESVVIAARALQ